MSKLLVAALAAGVIWAAAQENQAATHITAEDILATIANVPEGRVSDQQIRHIDAGGHNVGVGLVHRPPTTSLGAIQHHNQTEVYYVVSGRGTLVTGGELTDPRPLDPEGNTVRTLTGPSALGGIAGGQSRDIGPGDMVIIPTNSPHGFSEIIEAITYIVVRVDPDQLVALK